MVAKLKKDINQLVGRKKGGRVMGMSKLCGMLILELRKKLPFCP